MSHDPRVQRTLYVYAGAGVALAIATALLTAYHNVSPLGWILLPAMALLAEFLPVTISRNGLRITFTLPFLAGMAAAVGATGALITDLLVSMAAALALNFRKEAIRP